MPSESPVAAIAHVIQLAIAPVFLISGVATLLSVLANRLGRIVDRARVLEAKIDLRDEAQQARALDELSRLSKRARLVNFSITFSTISALLICISIVTLFTGTFLPVSVAKLISVLFVAAMFSLFLALLLFLSEVITATRALRISSAHHRLDKSSPRPPPLVQE